MEEEQSETKRVTALYLKADNNGWSAKRLARYYNRSTKEVKELLQKQKQDPTVYDAVADRVTNKGQLVRQPFEVWDSNNTRTPNNRLAPDEVLAHRCKGTPLEGLAPIEVVDSEELPRSDLLESIHQYASDYYEATHLDGFKFMDETALLAFGVLMEEQIQEYIGISR